MSIKEKEKRRDDVHLGRRKGGEMMCTKGAYIWESKEHFYCFIIVINDASLS